MRGTVTALRRVSGVNLPTLAVLLALLMAISPALFAQEASGGITGKVTDPSGAAADVVTRDVDRGTVWTTKTNEGGVYNFARLPIGRYEVKVQATGFQAAPYVYNVGLDYGLCDADVTNAFNGYVNYDLPFGHGRTFGKSANKAVNAVLGGVALRRDCDCARRTADLDDPVRQRPHERLLPAASGLSGGIGSNAVQELRGRRLRLVQPAHDGDSGSGETGQLSDLKRARSRAQADRYESVETVHDQREQIRGREACPT